MFRTETINLTEDGRVRYEAYIPGQYPDLPMLAEKPSILILPGGGLTHLSNREGESVALAFAAKGFNAFVLHYSLHEYAAWPHPLTDAMKAMKSIRERLPAWGGRQDAVAVCGFSAGGQIAASLAVYWNDKDICAAAGVTPEACKPDAVILNYPVLTPTEQTESGTLDHLRQGREDIGTINDILALERHVGPHTPPCFIMHAYFDNGAPVTGSMVFALALARNGVPLEMHIPQDGAHGVALADETTYTGGGSLNREFARWPEMSAAWVRKLFGMYPAEPERVWPSARTRCR